MSLNPNTLVCVSAYAGDAEQVINNMPWYRHHGCQVVVMTPEDAPITEAPGALCLMAGKKGWTGPQTLQRHVKFLELMLSFPAEFFLFNDSDSICLSPEIPKYLYDRPDTIWSNEVLDTNPGPSKLAKIAMQPPYFLSRAVIKKLLEVVPNPPMSYYGEPANPEGWPMPFPTECIDHYHWQLAAGTGLEHMSYFTGASFETKSPVGLNTMVDLVQNHGRVLIHSVKTKEILLRLAAAHKEFKRTHR